MRYFLEFAYNGKNYFGYQIQPNHITIQEVLEKSLSLLLREKIEIVAAGRTDTGVHAKQIFAHFDTNAIENIDSFLQKLNAFLPKDIAALSLFEVHENAHARFDAVSRTYHYIISTKKNPFALDGVWFYKNSLNVQAMNQAAHYLLQHQDFECFSKHHTDVKTFLCTITEAFWKEENELLIFTITANRFLRNMVRAIVGTLVNIGLEKHQPEYINEIIASKNRSKAGFSVPAQGLYLVNVSYPNLTNV